MQPLIAVLAAAAVADPQTATPEAKPHAPEPFAYADWGWLNGNSRQTDFPITSNVITGTFTIESADAYEFSHPKDHTVVGSTAIGRSNELQIVHLGVGADFHWKGARGRIMTQLGLYSTMTPRNDASPSRGQWDLASAYRYITEGYGGYHFDVANGLNVDAGIFLSYIGLCSYYNYENRTDQASYVSSNTPWFFNGIRIQYFPTDKLKIEPWIINGWQSYGTFNEMPGSACRSPTARSIGSPWWAVSTWARTPSGAVLRGVHALQPLLVPARHGGLLLRRRRDGEPGSLPGADAAHQRRDRGHRQRLFQPGAG